MSTHHPHSTLTASEKAQTEGLIVSENSRAPSMVFRWLRPMLAYRRWSYQCWKLCPWSRNGSHSSKQRCTGNDHDIPCHTRRRLDEILATVCSRKYPNMTISTSYSGEKTSHCLTWILSTKIKRYILNICPKYNRFSQKLWKWHAIKSWHFLGSPCKYKFPYLIYIGCNRLKMMCNHSAALNAYNGIYVYLSMYLCTYLHWRK